MVLVLVVVLELFKLALNNLKERRLRSFLTVVGIFIGITAVVALISLGDGLQNVVVGQFAKIRADKITIMGTNGFSSSPFVSATLPNPISTEDLNIVRKSNGVDDAGDLLLTNVNSEFKRQQKMTFLLGVPDGRGRDIVRQGQNIEIASGREIMKDENGVVAIGSYVADGLFDKKVYVGDTIKLEGKDFKVVGIMKSRGSKFDDNVFYMNIDEGRNLVKKPKLASMIIARIKKGEDGEKVAKTIEENLRKHRNVKKGSEDFTVQTAQQLANSFAMVLGVVQAVVVGIALISLLIL